MILSILISNLYAAEEKAKFGFDFLSLAPLFLIFSVFYFFLIRPQQKKAKEHAILLSTLKIGDKVTMSGGLIGTISALKTATEIQIEIAPSVRVNVLRSLVTQVLSPSKNPTNEDSHKAEIAEQKPNKS